MDKIRTKTTKQARQIKEQSKILSSTERDVIGQRGTNILQESMLRAPQYPACELTKAMLHFLMLAQLLLILPWKAAKL
jgi:hypothetical protein